MSTERCESGVQYVGNCTKRRVNVRIESYVRVILYMLVILYMYLFIELTYCNLLSLTLSEIVTRCLDVARTRRCKHLDDVGADDRS